MQEELEQLLASLIAIPSESKNRDACYEIITFIAQELQGLDLFTTVSQEDDNPYIIATTKKTRHPHILLAAHLDVVPAHTSQFTLTTVEDKLYGRGAFDMKFAAACFLTFAKQQREQLKNLDIGFLFTTDEEIGGKAVRKILEDGWRTDIVFIPDGGMDWKVEKRAKGALQVEVTAIGKSAHGSRPWEGENALYKVLPFLSELRQRYPMQLASDRSLTFTTAKAGTAWNQVPDTATFTMDFRAFEPEVIETFRELIAVESQKHDLNAQITHEIKPLNLDTDHHEVKLFLEQVSNITGEPAEFSESYGATDGHWFAHYNIPSIIMQPGGGGHHSPTEWLQRDDLEKYYQLLENWLLAKR